MKPAWFPRVWAATGFTNSNSNCKNLHFWKPTAFTQCLKDISAQALSSEHPKFPFSYWKAQRLELYNNKCIHKIIKCLYCTIYFAVKTCLFLFNLKGFSVFSHVKHEHESHQLLFKKIQASSSHNNKKKKTWEVKTFIKKSNNKLGELIDKAAQVLRKPRACFSH